MDELDKLKQDWSIETNHKFKTYSEQELFQMTKKKSISITQYLVILGITEITLWCIFDYYFRLEYPTLRFSTFGILTSLILFFFYKIKSENNSKELMKNILYLRYIILGYILITISTLIFESIVDFDIHTADFIRGWNKDCYCETTIIEVNTTTKIIFAFLTFIFFIILIKIYKTTYGRLLKKLEKNYFELNKIENSFK